MKNKFLLLLIILLIMTTGCGNKNMKTLVCTVTSNEEGRTSTSELKIKVRDQEVEDMRLTLNMILADEEKAYKQMIIAQMKQKTDRVYSTNDGIKAIFGMDSTYFDGFGISKEASVGEIKQVLELQGYTCK